MGSHLYISEQSDCCSCFSVVCYDAPFLALSVCDYFSGSVSTSRWQLVFFAYLALEHTVCVFSLPAFVNFPLLFLHSPPIPPPPPPSSPLPLPPLSPLLTPPPPCLPPCPPPPPLSPSPPPSPSPSLFPPPSHPARLNFPSPPLYFSVHLLFPPIFLPPLSRPG